MFYIYFQIHVCVTYGTCYYTVFFHAFYIRWIYMYIEYISEIGVVGEKMPQVFKYSNQDIFTQKKNVNYNNFSNIINKVTL